MKPTKVVWTRQNIDKLLNLFFQGKSLRELVAAFPGATKKAISRQLELFVYLEKSTRITDYEPTRERIDRTELPFTKKEVQIILKHLERQVSYFHTARILGREPEELEEWMEEKGLKKTSGHQGFLPNHKQSVRPDRPKRIPLAVEVDAEEDGEEDEERDEEWDDIDYDSRHTLLMELVAYKINRLTESQLERVHFFIKSLDA